MEAPENVDVALTMRLSGNISLDDWYLIERAEHDGRSWLEARQIDGLSYSVFMRSARLVYDTDIEGTGDEMLKIASAIEARTEFGAKRCAVVVIDDRVLLWNPRNSRKAASVPLASADALAAEIKATLS